MNTQENIKTLKDIKLINAFLKLDDKIYFDGIFIYSMDRGNRNKDIVSHPDQYPNYSNDFNELMKAVYKIEKLGFKTSFKSAYCRINPIGQNYDNHIVKCYRSGFTTRNLESDTEKEFYNCGCILRHGLQDNDISKLRMIYICVVEFVKYYNNEQA